MTGPAQRLVRLTPAARRSVAGTAALGVAAALLVVVQAGLLADLVARAFLGGAGLAQLTPALLALTGVVGARAALGWAAEAAAERGAARVVTQARAGCSTTSCCWDPGTRGCRRRAGWPRSPAGASTRWAGTPAATCPSGSWRPSSRSSWACGSCRGLDLRPAARGDRPPGAGVHGADRPAHARAGRPAVADADRPRRLLPRRRRRSGRATAFGRARGQSRRIAAVSERHRAETMRTLRVAFLSALTLELLASLSVALVAVSVGLRLVAGDLDLATGLLVIMLAPEVFLPLRAVSAGYHDSAEGVAAADAGPRRAGRPRPLPGARTGPRPRRRTGAARGRHRRRAGRPGARRGVADRRARAGPGADRRQRRRQVDRAGPAARLAGTRTPAR